MNFTNNLLVILFLFCVSPVFGQCPCDVTWTVTNSQIGECCYTNVAIDNPNNCSMALSFSDNHGPRTINVSSSYGFSSNSCAGNGGAYSIVVNGVACLSGSPDCEPEPTECNCASLGITLEDEHGFGEDCCSTFISVPNPDGCEFEFEYTDPFNKSQSGSTSQALDMRVNGCTSDPGSYRITMNGETCLEGVVDCTCPCPDVDDVVVSYDFVEWDGECCYIIITIVNHSDCPIAIVRSGGPFDGVIATTIDPNSLDWDQLSQGPEECRTGVFSDFYVATVDNPEIPCFFIDPLPPCDSF